MNKLIEFLLWYIFPDFLYAIVHCNANTVTKKKRPNAGRQTAARIYMCKVYSLTGLVEHDSGLQPA